MQTLRNWRHYDPEVLFGKIIIGSVTAFGIKSIYDYVSIRYICNNSLQKFKELEQEERIYTNKFEKFVEKLRNSPVYKVPFKFDKERIEFWKELESLINERENWTKISQELDNLEKSYYAKNGFIQFICNHYFQESDEVGVELSNCNYYTKKRYQNLLDELNEKIDSDLITQTKYDKQLQEIKENFHTLKQLLEKRIEELEKKISAKDVSVQERLQEIKNNYLTLKQQLDERINEQDGHIKHQLDEIKTDSLTLKQQLDERISEKDVQIQHQLDEMKTNNLAFEQQLNKRFDEFSQISSGRVISLQELFEFFWEYVDGKMDLMRDVNNIKILEIQEEIDKLKKSNLALNDVKTNSKEALVNNNYKLANSENMAFNRQRWDENHLDGKTEIINRVSGSAYTPY